MSPPNNDIHKEKILILDFGSQYTQLIARRVRESGIYCEIHSYDLAEKWTRDFDPAAIILSGGPDSVNAMDTFEPPRYIYTMGVPILGICYGMQIMAKQLGGQVETGAKSEFGYAQVELFTKNQLFGDLEDGINIHPYLNVWMSHGDEVVAVPPGFSIGGSSENTKIAFMMDESRKFYGLQFHPEVNNTVQGSAIIDRFVKEVCNCQALWTSRNIVDDLVRSLRKQVGRDRVVLGLSGGVDSSVVAALLSQAIGDQLTCVFVDNGLLRLDEVDQVVNMVRGWKGAAMELNLVTVNAEDKFLEKLQGISDPEEKRKIIGNTFIQIFDEEAAKIPDANFLAQGTIYPDVIESAGNLDGQAHVIKSHHNVGGLPDFMKLKLVEPLRELFKDEVRRIGVVLGLSHEMVYRHPFPGPGLGVRILGEIKKEYADMLRAADNIYMQELREADLYDQVSQAFAVFLPVRSVGVVGDARRYEYVVALRAVETIDFMTARWARLPYDFLERVSTRIINEISGISRVTYDISSKPPATIEWE
ncbi:MAG: glutamine-hydrolyzing GMP synthase [Gammaproteobacteria bacterium]|nr:glutamine-hydrolyzing GMP synthase [Gammaproteobacteria bacterium]